MEFINFQKGIFKMAIKHFEDTNQEIEKSKQRFEALEQQARQEYNDIKETLSHGAGYYQKKQ